MVDEDAWQALLQRQRGVVAREQALALGWHRRALANRLARSWQRLLPSVYLTTTGQPTWEQRAWAGVLRGGVGAALTSFSGLAVHGLADEPDDVHVVVRRQCKVAGTAYLVGGGELVLLRSTRPFLSQHALPVAPVARCVTDACLALSSRNRVRGVVSHAVQRGRTTVALLRDELALAPQRGSGHLRAVLEEVAEGARSAPEAVLARALRPIPLPPYSLNSDVHDDRGAWLARVDVAFHGLKLAVEVDGQRWHLSADRWLADVERHTRLEVAGWTVLRYPASRVLTDAAGVVAEIASVARRLART